MPSSVSSGLQVFDFSLNVTIMIQLSGLLGLLSAFHRAFKSQLQGVL